MTCSGISFIEYSQKSKDWIAKSFKVLGAIRPKDLNRIAKIGYGHL
jgi:hypothetical protein